MANQKYDNLTVMMTSGGLNWPADPIIACLATGVIFDHTDIKVSDAGGSLLRTVPVPGRSVDPTGALLGLAVSFNGVPKDTMFQVILAKAVSPVDADASLIAFYDSDVDGTPLQVANNGTLIVRPTMTDPAPDSSAGVWVSI